jgi:peptidoglycan/xylan/chitin deacetylase (PgdA/CDA1 family)
MDPLTRRLFEGAGSRGPLVLMYHSIAAPGARIDWPWQVAYADFIAHLDLLAGGGWRTASLAEIADEPGQPRTVVISFDDGYVDNLAAFEALGVRGMRGAWFVVSGHVGRTAGWSGSERPGMPMLGATHLRLMHRAGMEIGSHTRNHVDLPQCDEELLRSEVTGSRRELEDLIGAPVTSFAYPYGRLNPAAVAAVREAGYTAACTTASGWAVRDRDRLRIRRLTIFGGDSLGTFARKLAFADNNGGWSRVVRYGFARARAALG